MKNNIKLYIAAALTAVSAVGCTDLDVDIESQYTSYPTTDLALEAKMADVYYQLRGALGRRANELYSLTSDEYTAVSFNGDYLDSYAYAHPSYHIVSEDDAVVGWESDVLSGITKANRVIVDVGGEDVEAAASPRAMRAYFTFIFMDGWGDTPILDHVLEDGELVDRSPRAEVAQWIESELLEIIPQLTEDVTENTYGRPTRWMAEALLAKLYINWPVYTASSVTAYDASSATNEKLNDCIALCDDIINSGKFSLGGGVSWWAEKFAPDNGYQVEDFIYALPYHTTEATGMQYGRARTHRRGNSMNPSYYGMTLSASCGAWLTMTPEYADLFYDDNGNARAEAGVRAYSVLCGPVYVYDPSTYKPTSTPCTYNDEQLVFTKDITLLTENDLDLNVGADVTGWRQGCHSIKFYVIDDDYKNSRNQSNDLPIFRYADILLTKAEAIVRGGTATNGDTAMSLFNQIRSYAEASTISSTPTLQDILDERGREFLDENWRRNDMIRFGTFEGEFFPHYSSNPNASFDKNKRLFPIGRDVLNTNSNWTQNATY